MKKSALRLCLVVLTACCLCGCASTKVTRTDVDKTVDLSGRWNDSDARMVAQEMIQDCLSRPWLNDFNIKESRVPVVIVGTILNRTSEHINANVFVNNLERTLINSGKVRFVASRDFRGEIREEKQDQAQFASKTTAKPMGAETGADFMLQGNINSVKDEVAGKYVVLYQVSLELVNMTTNEKTWVGEKEIKKVVIRKGHGL